MKVEQDTKKPRLEADEKQLIRHENQDDDENPPRRRGPSSASPGEGVKNNAFSSQELSGGKLPPAFSGTMPTGVMSLIMEFQSDRTTWNNMSICNKDIHKASKFLQPPVGTFQAHPYSCESTMRMSTDSNFLVGLTTSGAPVGPGEDSDIHLSDDDSSVPRDRSFIRWTIDVRNGRYTELSRNLSEVLSSIGQTRPVDNEMFGLGLAPTGRWAALWNADTTKFCMLGLEEGNRSKFVAYELSPEMIDGFELMGVQYILFSNDGKRFFVLYFTQTIGTYVIEVLDMDDDKGVRSATLFTADAGDDLMTSVEIVGKYIVCQEYDTNKLVMVDWRQEVLYRDILSENENPVIKDISFCPTDSTLACASFVEYGQPMVERYHLAIVRFESDSPRDHSIHFVHTSKWTSANVCSHDTCQWTPCGNYLACAPELGAQSIGLYQVSADRTKTKQAPSLLKPSPHCIPSQIVDKANALLERFTNDGIPLRITFWFLSNGRSLVLQISKAHGDDGPQSCYVISA